MMVSMHAEDIICAIGLSNVFQLSAGVCTLLCSCLVLLKFLMLPPSFKSLEVVMWRVLSNFMIPNNQKLSNMF